MIEAGIAVGGCLLWSLWKMPWSMKMHLLSNPILVDSIVFLALLLIHWGTFSGVMAATIGAGICSASFSVARGMCGHVEAGEYIPGFFDFGSKLKTDKSKSAPAPKAPSSGNKRAHAPSFAGFQFA